MKMMIACAAGAATLLLAGAAPAMTFQPSPAPTAGRGAAVDPDARLEALAAASTRVRGSANGRSTKADRSILKDDPYLRAAFAWLDNK